MQNSENPTFVGTLARLGWMMFGPPILLLFAIFVVKTGNGWLTMMDFGFLAVLAALILLRWLDFQCGHPQTAEGEPATPAHLRRYAIGVIAVGLAVWVIANILGNYVMTG